MTAASVKADCRILYFRCEFDEPPGTTLQDALRRAFSQSKDGVRYSESVRHRRYDVSRSADDDESGECLFINHFRGIANATSNNIFGDLCRYRPGGRLATLIEEDNAPEFEITLLGPQARAQFLTGLLYWRISGNDVLVVQSRTARYRSLERYLWWFLVEESAVLSNKCGMRFTQSIKVSRNNPLVKQVAVSGPVGAPSAALKHIRAREADDKSTGDRLWFGSKMLDALRPLFSSDNKLQVLLDKIPEDEQVTVELILKFPNALKMIDPIRLDDVSYALAGLNEATVMAKTDSGRVHLGDLIQRPEFITRVVSRDGIWDRNELVPAFSRAWDHFKAHGFLSSP